MRKFTVRGITIDPAKLMTRQEVLDILEEDGGTDRGLAQIRNHYHDIFGNELAWRYPYSDGLHIGTVIVVVQEGFLSLPYDIVDKDFYEFFELEEGYLFDTKAMQCFIDDFTSLSADLLGAMQDMRDILVKRGASHE